jgi:hypothetical protein
MRYGSEFTDMMSKMSVWSFSSCLLTQFCEELIDLLSLDLPLREAILGPYMCWAIWIS